MERMDIVKELEPLFKPRLVADGEIGAERAANVLIKLVEYREYLESADEMYEAD